MRKVYLFTTLLLCAVVSFASGEAQKPILNIVAYPLTTEKWVSSSTAKVTVSVDASLDKLALASANAQVTEKLSKIAKADWHITEFTRSQDLSGLEKLHVEAQARISANALAGLRDNAKSVTRPGETYNIENIDFSPSFEEMEQARTNARAQIYQTVKQEIARLNQIYPEQHYFLHKINFSEGYAPMPVSAPRANKTMVAAVSIAENNSATMTLNAKILMNAMAEIASIAVNNTQTAK